MTKKARSQDAPTNTKVVPEGGGNDEKNVVEKLPSNVPAVDNNNNDQVVSSNVKAKTMRLPRQMIRVQRSEPESGVVRNELRFVSYSVKNDNGQNPVEMHVVSEAFGALISRLRELNIYVPDIEQHVGRPAIDQNTDEIAALRQQLAASEEECERLRRNIEEIRNVAIQSDASSVSAMTEPEWVRHTEAKIKAVTEDLQPIHYQAQRFAPKIADLKAHLRQILDEIQDRRLKGQLHDDRIREQINAKIQHCHRITSETIRAKQHRMA